MGFYTYGFERDFREPGGPMTELATDTRSPVVEPDRQLAFSWNASGDQASDGLKTIVT
jgi:hypothetical protein